MGYPNKIATCCYCGTRAALVLKGGVQHELACSSCGAPLHDLKHLPTARRGDRELVQRRKPAVSHAPPPKIAKRKQGKPRKSLFRMFVSEALDLVEDILD